MKGQNRDDGNNFEKILLDCKKILKDSTKSKEQKLSEICRLLASRVEHYDWVGFYLVDPNHPRELVLGPHVGEPTEHVRIPFGRGICGQAAESGKTFVVQDVSKETNYLSCSPKVKSEIVVHIFKNDKIVGELDIDSHELEPFTTNDEKFLEELCHEISTIL